MAKTVINSLKKATEGKDKGYFVMVEASRIDHAAHVCISARIPLIPIV